MKYVKKPLIVDSIKYTGSNLSEVIKFCSVDKEDGSIQENCLVDQNQLFVINKGFVTPVMLNEHIVKDITSALSVFSPELFNYSFEPANHNQEVIKEYEKKKNEAPFSRERFDHSVNSAIDVNYMQGKYIVFKQQSFSVCFYVEQIPKLREIVNKIYDTIQSQEIVSDENDHTDLIKNSQKPLLMAKSSDYDAQKISDEPEPTALANSGLRESGMERINNFEWEFPKKNDPNNPQKNIDQETSDSNVESNN